MRVNKPNYKNIIFNIAFSLSCLASVCSFWKKPFLLTFVLIIVSFIGLYRWRNKENFILFILGGLFGATTEAIAISFGVWTYTLPDFYGIPFWLPVLWGDASVFSYQTAIELKRLLNIY